MKYSQIDEGLKLFSGEIHTKHIMILLLLTLFCMSLTGCGNKTKSFDEIIDSVRSNEMIVVCSKEVNNKDETGDLCNVKINNNTELKNERGNEMSLEDFSGGDKVRVVLSKSTNLQENRTFLAEEIIFLERTSSN